MNKIIIDDITYDVKEESLFFFLRIFIILTDNFSYLNSLFMFHARNFAIKFRHLQF